MNKYYFLLFYILILIFVTNCKGTLLKDHGKYKNSKINIDLLLDKSSSTNFCWKIQHSAILEKIQPVEINEYLQKIISTTGKSLNERRIDDAVLCMKLMYLYPSKEYAPSLKNLITASSVEPFLNIKEQAFFVLSVIGETAYLLESLNSEDETTRYYAAKALIFVSKTESEIDSVIDKVSLKSTENFYENKETGQRITIADIRNLAKVSLDRRKNFQQKLDEQVTVENQVIFLMQELSIGVDLISRETGKVEIMPDLPILPCIADGYVLETLCPLLATNEQKVIDILIEYAKTKEGFERNKVLIFLAELGICLEGKDKEDFEDNIGKLSEWPKNIWLLNYLSKCKT